MNLLLMSMFGCRRRMLEIEGEPTVYRNLLVQVHGRHGGCGFVASVPVPRV